MLKVLKTAEPATRKRKHSADLSSDSKRSKQENDSNLINSKADNEIKLVKKKKNVELPQDLLEQVQHLKMEHLMKSFCGGEFNDFYKHCVKIMSENPELVDIAHDLTVE